ncbi:MAG: ABC transporter permease [Anaerolineaceae bacterium]|nr:ABC transporter permease [Anaerolineaceae bacterium]
MTIFESIKLAWKSLLNNKSRSLLTMLGVIIGVGAVIVMMSVSAGTEVAIAKSINDLGTNLIFITPNFTRGGAGGRNAAPITLVYDDVLAIQEEIDQINGVAVDQTTSQDVSFGSTALEGVTVVGTTPDYLKVRGLEIADGKFFDETAVKRSERAAILGYSLARELFGENETPVGQEIKIGSTRLIVIGVLEERGMSSSTDFDNQVYVPINLVYDRFMESNLSSRFMGDSVRMIYVSAESQEVVEDVILQTSLLLAKRHEVTLEEPDFSITTQMDLIETQESTTASFRMLLGWVAGVSLIVGGIGIMNIMLVSVSERTREIGLRMSIGATPRDILSQFLIEALMLSVMGGTIGILLGVAGSYAFGYFSDMPTFIMPESILLSFLSSAVVGVMFGYLPANRAAKLDPIVALRHF